MKFEYYSKFFDVWIGDHTEDIKQKNPTVIETDFEVVESTLLSDQDTCSGHECFYKRTGVKCITCKNQ